MTALTVEKKLATLATICGRFLFKKDEWRFLEIYTVYLFNKRDILSLTLREVNVIHGMYRTYYGE